MTPPLQSTLDAKSIILNTIQYNTDASMAHAAPLPLPGRQQTTRRLTESGGRRELGLDEVTGAG